MAFQRLGTGQYARSFILDGLRGVGKTVLLNEADVMARKHGWISSGVVECNEDDDLPLLMARLCHRALRRLSAGRRVGGGVARALMHGISQQNAPVLLIGAGLPQLPLMLKNAKPYTERLFDFRTIGGLPRSTAATALAVPAERQGARFTRSALELILDRTQGYPHFLQQWGKTVWREAEGSEITLGNARAAEELVNDELDRRFFRDRYEKATGAERIYMAAMADLGDESHSSAEIAAHMGAAQKDLSVRRAGLIDKGLIYNPVASELDFTVPQFGSYLRRIHRFDPSERPKRGRRRSGVRASTGI